MNAALNSRQFQGQPLTATEVPQSAQVPEWVRNIDSELEQLGKAIVLLNEKISPLCRPAIPTPVKDQKPEEMLVPLADKLRSIHHTIQGYACSVEDTTARLEL